MEKKTLLAFGTVLALILMVGGIPMAQAGTTTNANTSSNAATPATPHPGTGEAATPAMPGNATAEAEVTAHRPDTATMRPTVVHPDIQKPNVHVPQVMGH